MTCRAGARPRFRVSVITLILALACMAMVSSATAEEIPEPAGAPAENDASRWERFPKGLLFPQLLADPRAPRTHSDITAYRTPLADFLAGSAGFDAAFGLFRRDPGTEGGAWQISLVGGVNALFDMDASSKDLMSVDFQIGLPVTWRRNNLAISGRFYHLSSHQGDDFLQNEDAVLMIPVRDMSFEALEARVAYIWKAWTVYGAVNQILTQREPLERLWLKGGIQGRGAMGPETRWHWIAGLDLHSWQETDWDLEITVKGGLELPGNRRPDRALRILLEYANGRVPFYQFFDLELTSYGLGLEYVF